MSADNYPVAKRARGERGVALVEFALILPFLSMLALTTIDMGRAYSLEHRLTNAAREGAAFAQYFPGQVANTGACVDPDNIKYHALGEDSGTTSGFTVTVKNVTTGATIADTSCVQSGIAPGTKLRVTVSSSFNAVTPFASTFFGGATKQINRSADIVVQG